MKNQPTVIGTTPMEVYRLNPDGSKSLVGSANSPAELKALLPTIPDFKPKSLTVAVSALQHEIRYHQGQLQALQALRYTPDDVDATNDFEYHRACMQDLLDAKLILESHPHFNKSF